MYDSTTSLTYVGLDVRKDTIAVAVLRPGREGADEQTVPNRPEAVRKLVTSWKHPETFRVCYEAGPTGYELQRHLASLGVSCQVVAPALVPRRLGPAAQKRAPAPRTRSCPCLARAGRRVCRRRESPRTALEVPSRAIRSTGLRMPWCSSTLTRSDRVGVSRDAVQINVGGWGARWAV